MPMRDMLKPGAWAILPAALDMIFHPYTHADGTHALGGLHGEGASARSALPDAGADAPGGDALYTIEGGVAVVSISGPISRRGGAMRFYGNVITWQGQDTIREAVSCAMADERVRAVLLSLDSPGGVASGVKELADFLAGQTAKPLYAYVDGLCASAAYWLASATGRVYAPRTAEVGSIGVVLMHVDQSAANTAEGLRVTYITGGKYKAAGNPHTPLSPADQSYLQDTVDKLHAIFRADVAARMPVDADAPETWGDAQVFLADDAHRLGLITEIVTDRAACLARIQKENAMDKTELAQSHPELLATIQREAAEAARAEASATLTAALADEKDKATAAVLGLVEAVCGAEAATKVQQLMATGVTAEQVKIVWGAVSGVFGTAHTETPQDKEADFKRQMLAAMEKAAPGAVQSENAPTDDVAALITRIGGLQ